MEEDHVEVRARCHRSLPAAVCTEVLDAFFAGITLVVRHLSSPDATPLSLELQRSRPTSEEMHQTIFRCPVSYDAADPKVRFKMEDLLKPSPLYEPLLFEQLRFTLGLQEPEAQEQPPMQHTVEIAIRGGCFTLENVAKTLGIGPRTIQRRLVLEGESFREILANTRLDLAQRMLLESDYSVDVIAKRLAYADGNSFRRALKEATGLTPSQLR